MLSVTNYSKFQLISHIVVDFRPVLLIIELSYQSFGLYDDPCECFRDRINKNVQCGFLFTQKEKIKE